MEGGSENKSHKMRGELLKRVQSKLDKGQSNNSISKQEGIREGTIRYAIQTGRLKKKQHKARATCNRSRHYV